jgi:hypothetical protein
VISQYNGDTMSNTMNRTIPFFWLAFYKDGSCLPQFDLDSGKQYSFKDIDQGNLDKFGLFPVPFELAKKLGPQYYYDGKLSHFILKLGPNQRLIGGIRREYQRFFSYSICNECGFKWQWIPLRVDGSVGDAGLPVYGSDQYSFHITNPNGKEVYEVICPKCGSHNDFKCPKCDKWWNKTQDESCKDLPQHQWTYHLECPDCKAINTKKTQGMEDHTIENIFLLGWQSTIEGENKKHIMFINQKGEFELNEDFNFK